MKVINILQWSTTIIGVSIVPRGRQRRTLTLVCDPLPHLNRLGLRAQRQEVALDDVFPVIRIEPEGLDGWQMV